MPSRPFGEDGTVQGLLKLANIPFVGAGVLGSAVGMDKDVMKRLLRDAGIPIARFITLNQYSAAEVGFDNAREQLGCRYLSNPPISARRSAFTKSEIEKNSIAPFVMHSNATTKF